MAKKKKSRGSIFHDYSTATYAVVIIIIALVVVGAFIAGHNHWLVPSKSATTEATTYITTTQAADETTTELEDVEDTTEAEETETTTTTTEVATSAIDEDDLIGETAAYEAALDYLKIDEDDVTWHSQSLMNNWLYKKEFRTAYMVTFYAPTDDVSDSRHVLMVDATTGKILQEIA